ncbi:MAG TPA: transglycosylase [Ktedonobacteraceae bacterium]|nr:transglycosylase [Ktedonobacteraceae bacterium]
MVISLTQIVIWILIALVVGFIGELIAGRRAPDGIIGAVIVGFLAIFIIVGLLHFHIPGEPFFYGVPVISTIIVAAILVFIWSRFAYRHFNRRYSRYYYRRGGYARRPRRRLRWF